MDDACGSWPCNGVLDCWVLRVFCGFSLWFHLMVSMDGLCQVMTLLGSLQLSIFFLKKKEAYYIYFFSEERNIYKQQNKY